MEDQSYVKVLEYRKRSAILSFDTLFFILTEVILVGMAIILGLLTSDEATATLIFIIMIVFIFGFTVIFVDTFFHLGIFYARRNTIGIGMVMVAVLTVLTLLALDAFNILFKGGNGETISTILFITLMVCTVMSFYFLYQAKPIGEDKTLVGKFETIKEELKVKPLSSMGLNVAVERALKWLQYEQDEEGYWHFSTPLYETSEILETMFKHTNDLSYQWQAIFNGVEETRNAEQVFYNILDANSTSMFQDNYFNLYPRKVIGMINSHIQNPKVSSMEDAIKKVKAFTPIEDERYEVLKKKILEVSAWDFITELEKGSVDPDFEVPSLFVMGPIAALRFENDVAQVIADILSETFNIVLSRATTRFNMRGEKQDVTDLILGMMYNTLIEMKEYNAMIRTKISDLAEGKESDSSDSSSIPSIVLPDVGKDLPSVPQFGNDTSIPSIPTFGEQTESNPGYDRDEKDVDELSIDLRLALARKHIIKKQSIDGGWGGDALTTAECLLAVAHNESVESEVVKMGVNFLLAIQKSNGSWSDDYVVTSRVVRALDSIQKRVVVQF